MPMEKIAWHGYVKDEFVWYLNVQLWGTLESYKLLRYLLNKYVVTCFCIKHAKNN